MKLLLSLFFLLASLDSFSICGREIFERSRADLTWSKAVDYKVSSMYLDVEGQLCLGVKKNLLEYVIYRDDSGIEVIASKKELIKNDVVFVHRSDFPRAAQLVTRSTHPLTIKLLHSYENAGKSTYKVGIKFLRNVGRGFHSDDLRLIDVNVSIADDEATLNHEGVEFDGINLSISHALKISRVNFTQRNYVVLSKSTLRFERTSRE